VSSSFTFDGYAWADVVGLLIVATTLTLLLLPRIRDSDRWRATVTPLASIIGSGFLVVAPLLANTVGSAAAIAMFGIVLLSLWIGSSIGYNIKLGEQNEAPGLLRLERASEFALAIAYVISIAFYVRLLASFVLRLTEFESEAASNGLATVVLLTIGFYGARRGLHGLERLEEYSVSIKLAIIAALLFWLVQHNSVNGLSLDAITPTEHSYWDQVRVLAGMILVVQGFETSKYLGNAYSPALRRSSMVAAQLLAGVIYVVFVAMVLPVMGQVGSNGTSESALIDVVAIVSPFLPLLLIVAAAMSQLSAAVADTLGAGGIVGGGDSSKVSVRLAYPAITGAAIVLTWVSNIFELVAIASRAFAVFYFLQAIQSFWIAIDEKVRARRAWLLSSFGLLSVAMVFVIIFAKSAES